MGQSLRKATLSFSILILIVFFIQMAHATEPVLTITTKEYHNLGEKIMINGTLTSDGSPVPNGLVSIQVNDPRGDDPQHNLFVMRVVPTGSPPPGPWSVEILEVIPCDFDGNPQSSFPRGGDAGFKVTVKNNCASPQHVIVMLTLYYSNGIPFATKVMIDQSIDRYQNVSKRRWLEDFIPGNAPLGTAYVYANALTNWTQYNGVSWCPEESASFSITSGGGASSRVVNTSQKTYTPVASGTFSTSFKISAYGGILGNYTVYATGVVWDELLVTSADPERFEAILIADVNGDGEVDMLDISIIIDAFLTSPGDPEWNPLADINRDNEVDMLDISIAIEEFGKWGRY